MARSQQSPAGDRAGSLSSGVYRSLDAYLTAYTRARQFSGVVLIAREGQLLFRRAYGNADVRVPLPNTPETKFMIFSMTKQFTAAAILLLQQQGLLNVHDPVSKYLPDWPVEWNEVTVHHLLTHTSGLEFDELFRWQKSRGTGRPVLPSTGKRFRRPKTKPGMVFEYSNSGYATLALMVEALSGETYQAFVCANIFVPLKMIHSGSDHVGRIEGRAHGYYLDGDALVPCEQSTTDIVGAGDMYSTVDDLLLWNTALDTDKLLSAASRRAMFTPYAERYGYGWWSEIEEGRAYYDHSGEGAGFCSVIRRYPKSRTVVIVLANMNLPEDGDFDFADIYAAAFGEKLDAPHIVIVPEQIRNRYVGIYRASRRSRTIVRQGARLYDATSSQVLTPRSNTEFVADSGALYRFLPAGQGRRASLAIQQRAHSWHAAKVQVHPVRWRYYAGTYGFRGAFKMRVALKSGGMLALQPTPASHVNLLPLTDTRFFVQDMNLILEFNADRRGRVDAITIVNGSRRIALPKTRP